MPEFPTSSFDGWQHNNVKDEVVDTVGLPFSDQFFCDAIPAVISQEAAEIQLPDSLPLGQISPEHKRSYQVQLGKFANDGEFQQTALWQDSYGNKFSTISTKGNNFSRHEVIESLSAPSGYIPYGLMEDDSLRRILRSSRLLREAGVDTEWPVRIIEPKKIMFGTACVFQEEYKKRVVDQVMSASDDFDKASYIAKAVHNMNFFVILRAMKIGDRPSDLLEDKTAEEALQRLSRIFTIYNQTHTGDSDYRQLASSNEEDRRYYVEELLPRLTARNLAKLHETGLAHAFPHLGNITALGGLVDLDSVKGEPLELGDQPVDASDWAHDISELFDETRETILQVAQQLRLLGLIETSQFPENNFLSEYISARGWNQAENLADILRIVSALDIGRLTDETIDLLKILKDFTGEIDPRSPAMFEFSRYLKKDAIEHLSDEIQYLIKGLDFAMKEIADISQIDTEEDAFNSWIDELIPGVLRSVEYFYSKQGVKRLSVSLPEITETGELRKWFDSAHIDDELRPLLAATGLLALVFKEPYNKVESKKLEKAFTRTRMVAVNRYAHKLQLSLQVELPTALDGLLVPEHSVDAVNGNFFKIGERIQAEQFDEAVRVEDIPVMVADTGDLANFQMIANETIDGQVYVPIAVFTDGTLNNFYTAVNIFENKGYLDLQDHSYVGWLMRRDDGLLIMNYVKN